MNSSRLRVLSVVLVVVGVAFMGWALRSDLDDLSWSMLPSPIEVVVLVVLLGASLLVSYAMWIGVLGESADRTSLATFLTAQAAKYIPGGVWHGLGQVAGHVGSGRSTVVQAGAAYGIVALAQVASAAVFGVAALALGMGRSLVTVASALVVVASAALLARPVLRRVLDLVARWRPAWREDLVVPSQARLLRVGLLGVVTLALQGGVLARFAEAEGAAAVRIVVAYGIAWAVGFLVLPLPAGLGLREFLLASLLPDIDIGVVVAASIAMRVAQVVAEVALAGVAQAWRARTP